MSAVDAGKSFLEHYGVKGMKWGVRRPRGSNGRVKGSSEPRAKDLSDEELKRAVSRMQLEKQYNSLVGTKTNRAGADFVKGIAVNATKNALTNLATQQVQTALTNALKLNPKPGKKYKP